MSNLLLATLPELLLVTFACVAMLVGLSSDKSTQRFTPLIALAGLVVAGVLVWAQQYWFAAPRVMSSGILVGGLSAYLNYVTLLMTVLIVLVAWRTPRSEQAGDFYAMILFSATGVMLAGSSADLVTLFFALELTSMPTYVLVTLSRTRDESYEAGTKYFFLGALAAAIMVYGFALIYGATGTTHLVDMKAIVPRILSGEISGAYWTLMTGLVIAICGLAFKLAVVPFHFYAPDVYCGAHPAVTGLLGYMPKAAGLAALVLLLTPLGWPLPRPVALLLAVLAILTMFWGNTAALLQHNVKRMLAYSSISHSGYMLIGVIVGPSLAGGGMMSDGLAAMLFYLAGYGIMNLGVFAVLSYLFVGRENAETLDDLAGLSQRSPIASVVLAVSAFSLMGMPPLIGFWGKLAIFGSAWTAADRLPLGTALVILGLVNSAIAAGYYLRLVGACYLQEPLEKAQPSQDRVQRVSLLACAGLVILLGILPARLYDLARSASNVPEQLQRMEQKTQRSAILPH